jgi:mannose-6-phosphate isomerase-like protein (cupin superfamily)
MVLIAHPAFPPASTAEVLAFIKANPGKVSCGASGALPSVGCELLRAHAGADLLMVLYKGNGPALNGLMGGEINLLFDVVNIAMGHVKSGRVRAIASTAPRRGIGPLGDLPVMAEAIPGFDLVTWHGMMVAPGTPRALVARLNREFNAVLQQPEVRQRMENSGQITGVPEISPPSQARLRRVWRGVARCGVQPETRRVVTRTGTGRHGALRRAGAEPQPGKLRASLHAAPGHRASSRRHPGTSPTAPACRDRRRAAAPRLRAWSSSARARGVRDAVLREMGLTGQSDSKHAGMHKTRSVDYAVVMDGEIDMILDDREVHLAAGDVLVQQGTDHAWVNRGARPCRIAFVLVDAADDNVPSTQKGENA